MKATPLLVLLTALLSLYLGHRLAQQTSTRLDDSKLPPPVRVADRPLQKRSDEGDLLTRSRNETDNSHTFLKFAEALQRASPQDFRALYLNTHDILKRELIAHYWIQRFPHDVFAYLSARKNLDSDGIRNDEDELVFPLWDHWLRTDPEAALAAAEEEKTKERPGSVNSIYAISEIVSDSDDATIIARAIKLSNLSASIGTDYRYFWGKAPPDPAALTKIAVTQFVGNSQPGAIETGAYHWSQQDPVGFESYLSQQSPETTFRLKRGVLRRLSSDPSEAARYLQKQPAIEQARLAPLLAGHWSETDPVAAFAWAHNEFPPNRLARIVKKIGQQAPLAGFESFLQFYQSLGTPDLRQAALKGLRVTTLWGTEDVHGLQRRAAAHEKAEFKEFLTTETKNLHSTAQNQ